jgi:hypothetical protein
MNRPDIRVEHNLELAVFVPLTYAGWYWIHDQIESESTRFRGVVCEPRYVGAIVKDARKDGLAVAA